MAVAPSEAATPSDISQSVSLHYRSVSIVYVQVFGLVLLAYTA